MHSPRTLSDFSFYIFGNTQQFYQHRIRSVVSDFMNEKGPLIILIGSIVSQVILFIAYMLIINMENALQTSSSYIPLIQAVEVLLTALDFGMVYALIKGGSE